jgi:glucan phosphoethanolaminetransferase (alkaline phosphatase superfamily)
MTLGAEKLLLGLIALFLLASIACFILKKQKNLYSLLWKKLMNFFISNTLVGAVLFFFNQEIVPFLSARIWFALWVIGMIVWISFIILYAKQLPARKEQLKKEREFKKYIP